MVINHLLNGMNLQVCFPPMQKCAKMNRTRDDCPSISRDMFRNIENRPISISTLIWIQFIKISLAQCLQLRMGVSPIEIVEMI